SVTDDAAELVPLPLLERPAIAIVPLQNRGLEPDRAYFADSVAAATAERPVRPDRTSVASAGNTVLQDDRGAGLALPKTGAPETRPSLTRHLLFAGAWVGLISLLVIVGWRLLSPPALSPAAKEPIALPREAESPAKLASLVPSIIVRPFINL